MNEPDRAEPLAKEAAAKSDEQHRRGLGIVQYVIAVPADLTPAEYERLVRRIEEITGSRVMKTWVNKDAGMN